MMSRGRRLPEYEIGAMLAGYDAAPHPGKASGVLPSTAASRRPSSAWTAGTRDIRAQTRSALAPISDLVRHRCINYRMTSAGTLYAWEFEEAGRPFEVRVPGPLAFNDPGLMLDCACQGLGIAYLLEHDVADQVALGALVRLLADWTPPFPGFFLHYPSRRQMRPVFAAFLDLLRRPASARR